MEIVQDNGMPSNFLLINKELVPSNKNKLLELKYLH